MTGVQKEGFAHFVRRVTRLPASAPLHSLTRPSLAAFLTSSQRSFRFESPNNENSLYRKRKRL